MVTKLLFAALAISSTFIQSLALAGSCTDTDVRDKMSSELREIFSTPFQQGDMGWCYAYGAADILTARLKKQVSPMHIGMIYSQNLGGLSTLGRDMIGLKTAGFYEGGSVDATFNILKKRGHVCSESIVNSNHSIGAVKYFLQSLESAYKDKTGDTEINASVFLSDRFPTVDSEKSMQALTSSKAKNFPTALLNIADQVCKAENAVIQIPKSLKLRTKGKGSSFAKFVDEGLKANKPVAIRYNMKRLRDNSGDSMLTANFAQHVSTVLGRKRVGNQCVYIVRNSWGRTCYGYASGIRCNEQEGTFELPAKELERSAYAAEYIAN